MTISRAVAIACLTVLKWLIWIMGTLLIILALKQYFIAEYDSQILKTVGLGFGAIISGFICRNLAIRFERTI